MQGSRPLEEEDAVVYQSSFKQSFEHFEFRCGATPSLSV
jgi:hypothetical protein